MKPRIWHDSVDLEYDGDDYIVLAVSYTVDHGSVEWNVDKAWITTVDDDGKEVEIALEGQEARTHPSVREITDWITNEVYHHAGL